MTDTDVTEAELREDIGHIKNAMGLAEDHPYWWRFWLVEGVGVAVGFPLLQLGIRDGFAPWLVALLLGVFVAHQVLLRRVLAEYERPTTGVPDWMQWQAAMFAGMAGLFLGLRPALTRVGDDAAGTALVVVGSGVVGVGYLYMGQLLRAYSIRRADRWAFYVGGLWILVLAVAVSHVPAFDGWGWAVLGVGVGLHNVASYLVLSRV